LCVSLFSISIKCLVSEKEGPTVSLLSPSFAVWKSNTQWQGQPRSHCFRDGTESLLRAWLGRINAFQRVVVLVLMNLMIEGDLVEGRKIIKARIRKHLEWGGYKRDMWLTKLAQLCTMLKSLSPIISGKILYSRTETRSDCLASDTPTSSLWWEHHFIEPGSQHGFRKHGAIGKHRNRIGVIVSCSL
jgi:hypothetical protein